MHHLREMYVPLFVLGTKNMPFYEKHKTAHVTLTCKGKILTMFEVEIQKLCI